MLKAQTHKRIKGKALTKYREEQEKKRKKGVKRKSGKLRNH
jgi:hypothetical protein